MAVWRFLIGALVLAAGVILAMGAFSLRAYVGTTNPASGKLAIVPTPITSKTLDTLRILFVGDMFFDRGIRFVSEQLGSDYPFACVDPLLKSANFVVGNLEGPITDNPSISFGTIPGSIHNYTFTFPTTTANTLLRHNIRAVTLGNNHILNFGENGLQQTHEYLSLAGVGYFGGVAGDEPIYRVDQNDMHLSFIGYNSFGGSSSQHVANLIADEHALGRTVIVFSHWGTEYSTSTADTRPVASLFAHSGADVIFGSHPHVVGPSEKIGNTLVYYSLGNFIFDQYFSLAVTHGLSVMLTVSPQGIVSSQEYPVVLGRNGQTCLDE